MRSVLCEKLAFKMTPVAVYFTDERPPECFQAQPGKRVCAASLLAAAASRGLVSAFDEDTYGCPGGGVGLCFGNAFAKNAHPTEALLSRGDEVLESRGETFYRSLGVGERFFDTPELVRKWADAVPYTETGKKYVVFKPLDAAGEDEPPDLVLIYANPDQISVLVTLAGYYRGTALNVVAPFASACQSILLAYQEIGREEPRGIMGYFDISQRCNVPREMLSLTVPFAMFRELDRAAVDGCLETPAWERIRDRWTEE